MAHLVGLLVAACCKAGWTGITDRREAFATVSPPLLPQKQNAAPKGGVFIIQLVYCLSRLASVTLTAVPPLAKKLPNWVCISEVTAPVGSKFSSGASSEL